MSYEREIEVELEIKGDDEYKKHVDALINEAQSLAEQLDYLTEVYERNTAAMSRNSKEVSKNIDDISKSLRTAEDDANGFIDAFQLDKLAAGTQAAATAFIGVEDNTRDYRKLMALLVSSSDQAGYSAEETASHFKHLYSVLGDENASAATLTSLQGLMLHHNDMVNLINASIGAWSLYGERIPIDALAEAMNETVKMGEATSTFSELLSLAGIKEDEFNAKLQAATTETERANAVMEILASEGLMNAGLAWQETNQTLTNSYEATNQLTSLLARVAEMVAPVISAITTTAVELANKILDFIECGSPMVSVITGLTVALGAFAVALAINDTIQTFRTSIDGLKGSFVDVFNLIKTNPLYLLIPIITGIIAAVIHLWNTNEDFRNAVNDIWNAVVATFTSVVNTITNFFTVTLPETFGASLSFFKSFAELLLAIILSPFVATVNTIKTGVTALVDFVKNNFSGVITFFKEFGQSIDGFITMISTAIGKGINAMVTGLKSGIDKLLNFVNNMATSGTHLVQNFINGIYNAIPGLKTAVTFVADLIRKYLHFTVPDVGPLADADEYGPDFMKLLSKGITDNVGLVRNAAQVAAGAMVVHPQMIAAGSTTSNMTRFGNVSINVYGAEGQSVNALADAVMDRMQMLVTQKEVAFSV